MKLVGKGTYQLISKPDFHYAITELRTAEVVTLSDYYYDILKEEKILIIDKFNDVKFVGVIDNIDFNFEDGLLKLYLTEYIGIIKYTSDLLGSPSYDVTYTAETVKTISDSILLDTGFTTGYAPNQTIASLEASKYNRLEWTELLNKNIECGLDLDGNYTTVSANIVSDKRATDIIVDYITNKVSYGVKGCFRQNDESHVWIQKTINLDDYIIEISQYKDKIFKYRRVVVLGDEVSGSAYVSSATDVPVKVITDDSCKDVDACNRRAETELNLIQKIGSITLKLDSDLFYSNNIEEGMLATITNPVNIAGEYIISEIVVNDDELTVTLGSPKQTLLTSLYDLEKRVNTVERWK